MSSDLITYPTEDEIFWAKVLPIGLGGFHREDDRADPK